MEDNVIIKLQNISKKFDDDVILDDTETYSVLGEEWNCKELKIEKR